MNASKCNLGVGGSHALAHLIKESPILEELVISSNKLKVEGARIIAKSIEESKSLKILDISSNIIRDKGMKAITEGVFESNSLQILSVKNNELKDEAFNEFIKTYMGHPATNLKTSLFSSNDISIYSLRLTA